MKLISLITFLLQSLIATKSQTESVFVSGKVEFTIKNMGLNVHGTMSGVSIQFKQPSSNPSSWSLEGTADPATISTGIGIRDQHLKKPDYFDIENHPIISLQSVAIKSKGKDNYEGTFAIMIKNTRKNIIVPFFMKKNGNSNKIEAEFSINRLDYGLGEESTILANNVTIRISALFSNM